MPHKNEMYDSFNEPYGETYCVDDGLWYDDDTEIFPEPLSKPIRPYNFSIISHLGEYYLEDKYGISEQNKEDLVDCMNWLKKENLGHIGDFAYNISFQIRFDDASYNFQYEYPLFRYLKDFIVNVKQKKKALFYSDCYSSCKFIVFYKDNDTIRFITQLYYEGLNDTLKNIIDIVIDRNDFVQQFERVLDDTHAYLKSYINEYCQTNGITISERRKMIERANFIIQNGYRQFQDDKEID